IVRLRSEIVMSVVATAAIASGALAAATDWNAAGKRWWSHVQYLADDRLEGRDTGSPGDEAAAAYVVQQFMDAELQPASDAGFAQVVQFKVAQIDESQS